MASAVDELDDALVSPPLADLTDDLRHMIGRCRSRGDWMALATPALDAVAARCGWPDDRLLDEIRLSIEDVEPGEYRLFLRGVLPLPFVPGSPWAPLRSNRQIEGRGEAAARAAFDISWDGANRAGQLLDGRSRREWAEELLAASLLRRVELAGSEQTAMQDDHLAPGRLAPAPRKVIAAITGILIVGTIVWVLAARSPSSGSPATTGEAPMPAFEAHPTLPERNPGASCGRAGNLAEPLADEPDASSVSARLEGLYERDRGRFGTGCPVAAAFRWDRLVVQELRGPDRDLPGAMVLSDEVDLILPPAAYGGYRRLGAANGSRAQSVGGAPLRVIERADGSVEVELATGALMVAEQMDAPFFWIAAQYVDWWRRNPQLGRPAGSPMPTLTQDYEFGIGQVVTGGTGEPQPVVVEDRLGALPASGQRRSRLLRQGDGTAWWVGEDDRRYWVATGAVWECLGGSAAIAATEVPGYAVAALAYGGHASCPVQGRSS